MKYEVLRNCYMKDVYYRQGDIKDLPEDLVGSSRHFRLVSEAVESTTEPIKENVCSNCGKECKSAFGLKSHRRVHKEA